MESKYKSIIVKQAEQDISQTLAYISNELHSPKSAQKLLQDLISTVDTITSFPYSMATLKDIKIPNGDIYRRAEVNNFVLIYKVVEGVKEVRIMAVFYAPSDVSARLTKRI
ncbi:MAG: type II toxin-antitoxin system RelE/ParE family toxin [Corallococcus sp.]|nr:type II toxin-antitoxin system RelE/ParE family toxin [Corallococcus sp.]